MTRVGVVLVAALVLASCGLGGDVLNVHIVPHTHDDVGWLKTVDQYYWGAEDDIQVAGVQYILDNVITCLSQNENRSFIYVETAFFYRWWEEQDGGMKELVRQLVAEGRLEFISGGWCMNDEASAHYHGIIDQMTQGHRYLLKEVGAIPRIGWQIDPFGHSVDLAGLFAFMGFDALFFGRADFQDIQQRMSTQNMEMVWRGSANAPAPDADLFTGILYNGYGPPRGLYWEFGQDPPIADDSTMVGWNVKDVCDQFYNNMLDWTKPYKHNEVLVPFGTDFYFQNAQIMFKNMDKLMGYMEQHPSLYPNMKVFYSTPSRYVDAVNAYQNENEISWELKTDDFFPYADNAHSYWTGYFTSRPAQKGYTQSRQSLLHSTELLYSLNPGIRDLVPHAYDAIDLLRRTFGVALHHDGITGTEKEAVRDDYEMRLSVGSDAAMEASAGISSVLLSRDGRTFPEFTFCPLLNMSLCPAASALQSGQALPVVIYNDLSWSRRDFVRIPIPLASVCVMNFKLEVVDSQVYETDPNDVLPDKSNAYTVVFPTDVAPLGIETYFVQANSSFPVDISRHRPLIPLGSDTVVENEYLQLVFDGTSNLLKSITDKLMGQELDVDQSFFWYEGNTGDATSTQASGAYIFRPTGTVNSLDSDVQISVIQGHLLTEVRQTFNPWVRQTYRLFASSTHVEVESIVGEIDVSDGKGKEVITRYSSSLATNSTWYSDSIGLEMQKRVKDYRPTWQLDLQEPVAGNYYPITTTAFLRDETSKQQFTLLTERGQGCASLNEGQLEVMLHRRLLVDDVRGVGEPLNETEQIRAYHYIMFNQTSKAARQYRRMQHIINNPYMIMLGPPGDAAEWVLDFATQFQPMNSELAPNALLLSLSPLDTGETILRLQNTFADGEDDVYSSPVVIDVNSLFSHLSVVSMEEYTLTANLRLSELHRLKWNVDTTPYYYEQNSPRSGHVMLKPMQIRTFVVELS